MTVLRNDPDAVSNWFNAVLAGIGHRGRSVTNIDAVVVAALTHDGLSRRFLFQEFKRPGEEICDAQWWALADLARQPNTTAWLVRQCDGLQAVEFTQFWSEERKGLLHADTVSLAEYRQRYQDWWNQPPAAAHPVISSRLIWSEYVSRDRSLQIFIEAEINRAHVKLQALVAENERLQQVAKHLQAQVDALLPRARKRSA